MTSKQPHRLLVVSSSVHYFYQGKAFAYGPYTREIFALADLFEEVEVTAPCRFRAPPGDCLEYGRSNISLNPQLATGGNTLVSKIKQFVLLPIISWKLARAMQNADAVHVRCPGNLGLVGTLIAPLFSKYRFAKYAGQWNGYEGERFSIRAQRWLLGSSWWGQPVTVYGKWPDQPPHVRPFFTSMMGSNHIEQAVQVASTKRIDSPLRILFSGRLAPEKRVDALLRAIKIAVDADVELTLVVLGDGTEREQLEALANELGIAAHVEFVGAAPFEAGLDWYKWAHCLVLPSRHSEGWPKVLAEAMCHGLACIAVRHGQIPNMLEGRGTLLEKGTPQEIADSLIAFASKPEEFQESMQAASAWSMQYSLDGLRDAIAELLTVEWSVPIKNRSAGEATEPTSKDACVNAT